MSDESEFLRHAPCHCGKSSDGLGVYSDGHTFCFVCDKAFPAEQGAPEATASKPKKGLIPRGHAVALPKRNLSEETCRRWDYTASKFDGESVQVANYRDPETGEVVAQKVRFANKDFKFLGDPKRAGLYGQHLWRDGGKRIIITEGEIDALTCAQALGHKWPVVSVPNGAAGARKALAKQLEWLNKFEQVVLCFDNDEDGRKATTDCAMLFPPGKVAVVHLSAKDPSELVQKGRTQELVQALWEAKAYRPDGVVTLADLRDRVINAPLWGDPWFLDCLTKATYGRRTGECVGLGAGTGIGKSDFIAEQIAYDLFELGLPVGAFMLEQHPAETFKRIAGKVASKRFHIPDAGWTQEELEQTVDKMIVSGRLYLYDHFGVADWEVIRETIRFLHHSEGVRHFYLDHLTALAAGAEEEERVVLERIMAELGGLVKELDIWLLFVSHLATPDGRPHEEGGRVMIRHFKGSRAIGFWSHFMLGLERDQQAEEELERQTTTLRILKDRYTGLSTGKTYALSYDHDTGRLFESAADTFTPIDDKEECPF